MTRSITSAVDQLYVATTHVNRADFSHRITVRSNDQLATLANSFNSMTTSIENLVAEQKEKQRMEGELAIAQEVQAQLYPKLIAQLETLEVHGFCRPARTVSGDYYDFLALSSDRLLLAVGDISGKGISAALLMATIHSALHAYSVENLPQMREPRGRGRGGRRGPDAWLRGPRASKFLRERCWACSTINSTKALRRKNMRRCFWAFTTGARTGSPTATAATCRPF